MVFEISERRRFKRWNVSIPCTVAWGEYRISGQVKNLSLGGALISRLDGVPPPVGASVYIAFSTGEGKLNVLSSVYSTVVRTVLEIVEDQDVGSIGIQFEDLSEEITTRLKAMIKG